MIPYPDMPRKDQIRSMFDSIAPSYDRLNHIMSLSVDRTWRRRSLREIVDGTPQNILDIACGTGDYTVAIAKAAAPGTVVTGADISEGMMGMVAEKAAHEGVLDRIKLVTADGENLPFGDSTFDRVCCAFGIRNFEDRERGLREFRRVLRIGGRAVILELSVPENKVVRWFYDLYFMHILPGIGGAVSGDKAAYRYLPASVHSFPAPEQFASLMEEAGFTDVRIRTFTFGLCRLYTGKK